MIRKIILSCLLPLFLCGCMSRIPFDLFVREKGTAEEYLGFSPQKLLEDNYEGAKTGTFFQTDWNNTPCFTDENAMHTYMMEQFRNCRRITALLLIDCPVDYDACSAYFYEMGGHLRTDITWLSLTGKNDVNVDYIVYDVRYSAGKLAVHGAETGDISALSEENREVLHKAEEFVETLDPAASALERERQIHDYICANTEYYDNPKSRRDSFRTAAGVLLKGKANCMGYADAFYLLCTLAGFETETVNSNLLNHSWNQICLDDKWYLVDVTWDDTGEEEPDYMYFNAGMDLVSLEYPFFPEESASKLVPVCDENYFYLTDEENFGYCGDGDALFFRHLALRSIITDGFVYVMCREDFPAQSLEEFTELLSEEIYREGSLVTSYYKNAGFMFASVKFTSAVNYYTPPAS